MPATTPTWKSREDGSESRSICAQEENGERMEPSRGVSRWWWKRRRLEVCVELEEKGLNEYLNRWKGEEERRGGLGS